MWIGNLKEIKQADLPLLVLADDLKPSFFGWGIKIHQGGSFTHAMWIYKIEKGIVYCISQELTLRKVPLKRWLKKGYYLKIWHNPRWTERRRAKVIALCEKELKKHWTSRIYDFLGIVGQSLHIDKLNAGWWDYCSENAGDKLSILSPKFKDGHPDPRDLNVWCMLNSPPMKVFDRYMPREM